MQRFRPCLRWLVALVVLTSTPGLGELVEGVVHAAVEPGDTDDAHHDVDGCQDACGATGCGFGFFHTCGCNLATQVPPTQSEPLPVPSETIQPQGWASPVGEIRAGYRSPPFRPPTNC